MIFYADSFRDPAEFGENATIPVEDLIQRRRYP